MSLLSERALLIDLDVGCWDGSVRDKRIERDVENAQNRGGQRVAGSLGRYHKNLIVSPILDGLLTKEGEIRKAHREMTLPWSNGGDRLITSTAFIPHADRLRKLKQEYEELADQFCSEYPKLVQERLAMWPGVFDPNEFPAVEKLRESYYVTVAFRPVPEAGDVRIEIAKEEIEKIKVALRQDQDAKLNTAVANVFDTVRKTVQASRDKLLGYKTGVGRGGPRMHESVLSGLEELAERLPLLNVTGSKELDALAEQLKAAVAGEDVEDLKKSEALRSVVAQRLDGVLGVMGASMGEPK